MVSANLITPLVRRDFFSALALFVRYVHVVNICVTNIPHSRPYSAPDRREHLILATFSVTAKMFKKKPACVLEVFFQKCCKLGEL